MWHVLTYIVHTYVPRRFGTWDLSPAYDPDPTNWRRRGRGAPDRRRVRDPEMTGRGHGRRLKTGQGNTHCNALILGPKSAGESLETAGDGAWGGLPLGKYWTPPSRTRPGKWCGIGRPCDALDREWLPRLLKKEGRAIWAAKRGKCKGAPPYSLSSVANPEAFSKCGFL